jgi:hypothetical protein
VERAVKDLGLHVVTQPAWLVFLGRVRVEQAIGGGDVVFRAPKPGRRGRPPRCRRNGMAAIVAGAWVPGRVVDKRRHRWISLGFRRGRHVDMIRRDHVRPGK